MGLLSRRRPNRACGATDELDFLPGDFTDGFQQHVMQDTRLPVVVAIWRYERLDYAQVQRFRRHQKALDFSLR